MMEGDREWISYIAAFRASDSTRYTLQTQAPPKMEKIDYNHVMRVYRGGANGVLRVLQWNVRTAREAKYNPRKATLLKESGAKIISLN